MSATRTRRAATYLRISLDHTGEGLAIDRQRAECARIVQQRGWEHVAEYADHSITASDARKNRPQYDALVKGFQAGNFDALVCYDLDRLTRQPRQLEDWIDAAQDRGLAIVTANGEADLTTDGGRMFARVKAAVARSEVERKSARQKAAAQQRAALGRPPLGTRLTGYTPSGEIVAIEADVVRRIFTMFGAGESLRGIVRTLEAQGYVSRTGRRWNPSSIRGILRNPRYAGLAIYQGELTGQRGNWEPLVTEETFSLVNARLTDPRRTTNREGTDRKHLGSGLYLCDECEEPVSSWSNGRYRCRNGAHVNRSRNAVDDYVRAVIAERLRRPDLGELMRPTEDETAPIVADVERLRSRLALIGMDYDAGLIDGPRFATATKKVRAELVSAEQRLAAVSSSSALSETLAAPSPATAFTSASVMAQRSIIDALCTVRIRKGTRYSRTFDPETVLIVWSVDSA